MEAGREPSRHRSAPRVAVPVPSPLARPLAVAAPLVSLLLPLAALVAAQTTGTVAQRLPSGAARFDLAGAWLAAEPGALLGAASWTSAPLLGRLQLGLLLRLLQAGEGQTVLAAAQTGLLLLAVAQAALLWWLLRRLGRSLVAAGMSVAAFAIAPAAVAVHATATTASVAVVWLLGSALLLTAGRRGATAGAGLTAAIAVATDPFVAVPVAVALAVVLLGAAATSERRAGPRPRPAAAVSGLAAGAAVLVAGAVVLAVQPATAAAFSLDALAAAQGPPAAGAAAIVLWATTDPLGVVVAVVALVVASRHPLTRPLVVAAGLLVAASIWPGGAVGAAPLVVLLAVVAPAVAWALDRAVVALAHPVLVRSVVGSGWLTGVAALLLVGVVVALTGLASPTPPADRAVARAERWLRGSVPPEQTVLVALGAWPDLARAGGGRVGWYATADGAAAPRSSAPWSGADYVVADAALGDGGAGEARRVLARSVLVARFGAGAGALSVRAVGAAADAPDPAGSTPAAEPPAPPATAAERRAAAARLRAGAQLAGNPRIELAAGDRALLRTGRVDTRVALVLAQLATAHRVTVAAFGTAPGDDSGIRTSVLISRVDGRPVPAEVRPTGDLLRFLSALRGDFATRSIDAGDDGVTAAFPPETTSVPSS